MDYEELACELMSNRAELLTVPASRQVSKLVRGELFVLNYLKTNDRVVHPKELSEKMAVSTARIASLLNHMEEKRFIVRIPDAEDSRQVIVRLTDAGAELIEKTRSEVIRHAKKVLEDLGPEDAEAYIRIQKKIIRNFVKVHNKSRG